MRILVLNKAAVVCKDTCRLFQENDMDVYAGFATLFIITALFPCLMLIISVVNLLPGYSPSDFTNFLFGFLPDMPSIKELFYTMISNLKLQSSGLLASLSALTTLWSASAGVSSLQRGLKKIALGGKSRLPDKAVALLFTLFFVILTPAIIVFQFLGNAIIEMVQPVTAFFGMQDFTAAVASVVHISSLVTMAAAFLVLLLTYTFLPGGKRSIARQLPGTLFTILTWFLFTKLFSVFIPRFYRSSGVYGSLAALFLMLLWLRFSITILLFGASLNHVLEKRAEKARRD